MKLVQIEKSSGKNIDHEIMVLMSRMFCKHYFFCLLCKVVQEQAAVIAQLNTKLKSVEENLEDANKCEILH